MATRKSGGSHVREKRLAKLGSGSETITTTATTATADTSTTAATDSQYIELDRLVTDLKPVATEWESLGIELEVEDLKDIGALFHGQGGRVQVCLRRVVLEWLNNSSKPATRDVLKKALEDMGQKRRAKDLPTGLECKLKPLLKELRPIAAEYHALGIQLGILPNKLKEFETEAAGQDVKRYLREVLHRWLQEGDCKLDTLVDGLIEISHRRLAEKLKKDYKDKQLVLEIPRKAAAAGQKLGTE